MEESIQLHFQRPRQIEATRAGTPPCLPGSELLGSSPGALSERELFWWGDRSPSSVGNIQDRVSWSLLPLSKATECLGMKTGPT